MANEIVPATNTSTTTALTKKELAASRLWQHINTPEKAAVVLATARSYGLDPVTVANGLYFVSGKPSLSAQLVATLLKRSSKYDYRVVEKSEKQCTLDFFEIDRDGKKEKIGRETFTMVMASRAGLSSGVNWKKYPEAMLWARCLTAGVRAHCPDALGGGPVYTIEELRPDIAVDAEGRPIEVIDVEPVEEPPNLPEIEKMLTDAGVDRKTALAYIEADSFEQATPDAIERLKQFCTLKLRNKKG